MEVGTVHVSCRAPVERQDDALALRRRLVETARNHLGAALDGSIPESAGRRVFIDRLEVPLDFDPSDYDDVTVARMWATRVVRRIGSLPPDLPGIASFASNREFLAAALERAARGQSLGWQFEELGCGTGVVRVAELLGSLQEPGMVRDAIRAIAEREALAAAVHSSLSLSERRLLLVALEGGAVWGAWRRGAARPAADPAELSSPSPPPGQAVDGEPAPGGAAPGESRETPAASPAAWIAAMRRAAADPGWRPLMPGEPRRARRPSSSPPSGRNAGAAPEERLEPPGSDERPATPRADGPDAALPQADIDPMTEEPAERAGRIPDRSTPAWWSQIGGLVLLYPWLPDYLSGELLRVEGVAGIEPETAQRVWALAALAGADPEANLGDPLASLLAGDDPGAERDWRRVLAEPAPGFEAAREGVLNSFRRVLPGFEESSTEYLRRWFIRRGAYIEPVEAGSYLVRLEAGPLDAILGALPFPLGPLALPWSPTILVERRDA
jgi:hypothetical protein